MTEKEFRKLNKRDLLEMLIFQTKRADEMQAALDEANRQLESREITFTNAGSLAEASLKLNGVFEAADEAVAKYLECLGDGSYTPELTGDADTDDLTRRQMRVNELEAKLKIKEAELQRREAALGNTAAPAEPAVKPVVVPALQNTAPSADMQASLKELDSLKAALDEREKAVAEREARCAQAVEEVSQRELTFSQADALLKEREAAFEAKEADVLSREKDLERFNDDINNYIMALCDRMKKISSDCDDIKHMADSFSMGSDVGAAADSAGASKNDIGPTV